MTHRSFALVINPVAGGGKPARYLPQVIAVLDAEGTDYSVRESTSLEHAQALAAAAARRGDTVVAFGGDGLTGALVGAVARETAVQKAGTRETVGDTEGESHGGNFGIIPAGRGNDFARTLRIPFDPIAATRVLLAGRLQQVDLIAVTDAATQSAPTMVAGSIYVGIASVANEIANRAKLIRGPAVYNLAALRALLGWKPTTFCVEATTADGQQATTEFRGYAVVVANCPFFGAGMKVAPDALPTDGLLDIVIMRHAPKLTFVRVLLKIKDGTHIALSPVSTFRVKAARLTVDRALPVGADGELLPVRAPLRIYPVHAALQVIVPG